MDDSHWEQENELSRLFNFDENQSRNNEIESERSFTLIPHFDMTNESINPDIPTITNQNPYVIHQKANATNKTLTIQISFKKKSEIKKKIINF